MTGWLSTDGILSGLRFRVNPIPILSFRFQTKETLMSKLMVYLVLSSLSIVGLTMSTAASTATKAGGCASGCCALCAGCAAGCDCCTTGVCVCDDCSCACCQANAAMGTIAKKAACSHGCSLKTSKTDALLAATGATVGGKSANSTKTCCDVAGCACADGCLCCQDGPCVCKTCDCACCATK